MGCRCGFLCFFFFSSRRRHTRYWRDWSSDVCSSDLRRPIRWPLPSRRHWIRSSPDRKSTRLNSSHANISYAVFCLKKKKKHEIREVFSLHCEFTYIEQSSTLVR